jgi:hypothetical protein
MLLRCESLKPPMSQLGPDSDISGVRYQRFGHFRLMNDVVAGMTFFFDLDARRQSGELEKR